MTIITKGMGAIMKAKMKKAGVKKPTFPGPNTINILNRELQKKQKFGVSSQDIIEGAARMRKGKPGKSFIEIDARVKRATLRDQAKSAKMPKEYKKLKGKK